MCFQRILCMHHIIFVYVDIARARATNNLCSK